MPTGELGRIATNINSMSTLLTLNSINQKLSVTMERITTGQKVNRAADDPAAFALGKKQTIKIAFEQAAQNNIREAYSMLQVAESQQGRVQDLLLDVAADLQRAMSSTIGSTERDVINTKLQQYLSEIKDIATTTKFNGVKLLSAASINFVIQVGETGKDVLTAVISGVGLSSLGLHNISATTRSAASAALSAITKALSALTIRRENIGARMSRLSQKLESLSIDILNTQSARSLYLDADLAQEEVNLVKYQILQSATLAMLSQANMAPQSLLQLLPR
ncbi:MAG: flagellin [Elusimicrobiales bacterium]|nr:flagellin [Elusimicrobiales bacterium]